MRRSLTKADVPKKASQGGWAVEMLEDFAGSHDQVWELAPADLPSTSLDSARTVLVIAAKRSGLDVVVTQRRGNLYLINGRGEPS